MPGVNSPKARLKIPQLSCFPAVQGTRWKAGQRTDFTEMPDRQNARLLNRTGVETGHANA